MKNSTQTTKSIRPVTKITPDFTHRYCDYNDSEDLVDSVNLMTDRALSVLALISGNFEKVDTIVNNNVIYSALSSIEHELRDIRAYLEAFHDAKKQLSVYDFLKFISDSDNQ